MDARGILNDIGIGDDPGYYSGRGATLTDLNSEKLEKVYRGIKKNHGKKAGDNFVQMVADISVLSATDFILSTYNLEVNGWKWDKKLISDRKSIYPTSEGSAFGTIMATLSGPRPNETESIRGEFLHKHGIKSDKNVYYFDSLI